MPALLVEGAVQRRSGGSRGPSGTLRDTPAGPLALLALSATHGEGRCGSPAQRMATNRWAESGAPNPNHDLAYRAGRLAGGAMRGLDGERVIVPGNDVGLKPPHPVELTFEEFRRLVGGLPSVRDDQWLIGNGRMPGVTHVPEDIGRGECPGSSPVGPIVVGHPSPPPVADSGCRVVCGELRHGHRTL